MSRRFALTTAVFIVSTSLAVASGFAQENRGGGGGGGGGAHAGGGGGGGGGTAVASGGGGGGGSISSSSGGGSPSGGGTSSGGGGPTAVSSGGAAHSGGGGHAGATGGSGVAHGEGRASRAESGGTGNGGGSIARHGGNSSTGASGTAIARGSNATGNSNANTTAATASSRAGDGTRQPRTIDGAPEYSRPRDGRDPVGTAVPRGTVPPPAGGNGIFVPGGGYYPCWNPAYCYGSGYYGGYSGYGYYGGYYDPWYGGYPDPSGVGQITYQQAADEGSLRLKIKPREGEVYVDGYYAGVVNDFDGMFQSLKIEAGPHRVEIRAPGYETLTIEVRITADHKTTYEGELKKIP